MLLKITIRSKNNSIHSEIKANRIKNNPLVFLKLLELEKKVIITPLEKEIIIGNPQAPINLTMAASLNCRPCKKAFKRVYEIYATYPDKISILFRFAPDIKDDQGIDACKYILEYWLGSSYRSQDEPLFTVNMVRDWYKDFDLKKFNKNYPLKESFENGDYIEDLLTHYSEWFNENEITTTPSFFIQGFALPKDYEIKDLKNLIPGLAEEIRSPVQDNKVSLEKFS